MNATEKTQKKIKREILNGKLKPSLQLKIDELKKRYEVGATPVRESLTQLLSTGLVRQIGNKGFRVISYTQEDVIDLFESFAKLELILLESAMINRDVQYEADIVSTLYRLSKLESGEKVPFKTWYQANIDFHNALIKQTTLKNIRFARDQLQLKAEHLTYLAFLKEKDSLVANHEEHKLIADSVIEDNIEAAMRLLRSHILGGIDNVLDQLEKQNLLDPS